MIDITYDDCADVLYVQLVQHPQKDCSYLETEYGIQRIAPDGIIVGLTIPFFLERNGVQAEVRG